MPVFTTCSISLPVIPGYVYTGEFRQVKDGEFYRTRTSVTDFGVCKWSGVDSHDEYFILNPKVDLSRYYMMIHASNIYTAADIESISDEYEIIDFRYPRFEEHYLHEGRALKRCSTKQLHLPALILRKKEKNNA